MVDRLGPGQALPPFSTTQQLPSQSSMNPAFDPSLVTAGQSRLNSTPAIPVLHQQSHHANGVSHSPFSPYGPASVSPGPTRDQPLTFPRTSGPSHSHSQMSVVHGTSQKRAYRQRRKDPSCDACRERKVKCDATDTISCSECHSRNVKCQFTKETNRRMSSMKQVQDLEKQLATAKAEIKSLRGGRIHGYQDAGERPQEATLQFPEMCTNPQRRPPPHLSQDLTAVRSHLRNFCRGIFKPPPPYRLTASQPQFTPPPVKLPDQSLIDHILSQYYSSIHSLIPILHWRQFLDQVEMLYQKEDFSLDEPPVRRSLLFAVLACGMLHVVDPAVKAAFPDRGRHFIEVSRQSIDFFCDEFTMDHARTSLLMCIYLTEMNCKSSAWTLLGYTVRIAQDIGLHREAGPWPIVEGEMRRRVWWGIYAWDRLLSLELGRVLLIDDGDCDIGVPCPVDDHFIHDSGLFVPPGSPQSTNFLLATIHIVRLIGPLLRILQSPTISSLTLSMFESHFNSCMEAFPVPCHIRSSLPLEPRHLPSIFHLQNVRIVLYRHNLSAYCPVEVRIAALDDCVNAARNTAHLLSRTMQWKLNDTMSGTEDGQHMTWQSVLAVSANAMLCTHIWRCTLFLLFRGYYHEALLCVQASSVIGDLREVNMACGRHLHWFLRILSEKLHRQERLEMDEGMIALVSGDVQGSIESSWVWTGSEICSDLVNVTANYNKEILGGYKESCSTEGSNASSASNIGDWGGWANIEATVRQLAERQATIQVTQAPQPSSDLTQSNGSTTNQATSGPRTPHTPHTMHNSGFPPATSQLKAQMTLPPLHSNQNQTSTASRISIANII